MAKLRRPSQQVCVELNYTSLAYFSNIGDYFDIHISGEHLSLGRAICALTIEPSVMITADW